MTIALLVGLGSDKLIARRLGLSVGYVHNRWPAMLRKFNVRTKEAFAMRLALSGPLLLLID